MYANKNNKKYFYVIINGFYALNTCYVDELFSLCSDAFYDKSTKYYENSNFLNSARNRSDSAFVCSSLSATILDSQTRSNLKSVHRAVI